ncbi:MAG: hypothetical protein IPM77_07495 [Crocinitomicaceae bacterium]|nr:hypothetical protein [Crocinitomicaceae bacterium]
MLDYILHLSPGILIALVIVIFIGLVSQAALYAKAGEPWIAALVPVWNVIIFVDVVGRPKWQKLDYNGARNNHSWNDRIVLAATGWFVSCN